MLYHILVDTGPVHDDSHHSWSSILEELACRPPRRLVLLCDQVPSTWQTYYLPLTHPHLGVKYLPAAWGSPRKPQGSRTTSPLVPTVPHA